MIKVKIRQFARYSPVALVRFSTFFYLNIKINAFLSRINITISELSTFLSACSSPESTGVYIQTRIKKLLLFCIKDTNYENKIERKMKKFVKIIINQTKISAFFMHKIQTHTRTFACERYCSKKKLVAPFQFNLFKIKWLKDLVLKDVVSELTELIN